MVRSGNSLAESLQSPVHAVLLTQPIYTAASLWYLNWQDYFRLQYHLSGQKGRDRPAIYSTAPLFHFARLLGTPQLFVKNIDRPVILPPQYLFVMTSRLNGIPFDFTYSESSIQSAIYLSVATRLGLDIYGDYCQCSVTVPAASSVFTSVLRFRVNCNSPCLVLLGQDWIGLCQTVMADGLVDFSASSYEGRSTIIGELV